MATTEKPVTLQDRNGHSREFAPKHAERLLKYPGTEWSEKGPKEPTKTATTEGK